MVLKSNIKPRIFPVYAGICQNLYLKMDYNIMDIFNLIKSGEGERVEFKKSLAEKREILETICAFLNSKGGIIIVGLDDDGNLFGIEIGKGTLEELMNEIKFSIEPMIIPSIEVSEVNGKKLLILNVPEGLNKPYFLKGIAYKRVGKMNQKLSREEIERIILEKYKNYISFEERTIKISLDEIDEERVKDFILSTKFIRNVDLVYTNIEDFLKRLGLIKDNEITYASLLCFFKNPQKFFPYAIVKCGKFKNGLVNEREISGNLLNQVTKTLEFLKENISQTYIIDEEGRRVEKWEIPIEVLREAIVNALIHRDYSIASPIYVKIYDDRIEVINPGNLLPPLTPEKLKKEHPSILRNPKIANIFFLYGYVERWGYGTNRMIEYCIKNGLREPEFLEENGFFKVIIYRKELNEIEKRILELIKKEVNTTSEIAKELKLNDRTVRKYLLNLIKKGIIIRKKIGKKVYYETI